MLIKGGLVLRKTAAGYEFIKADIRTEGDSIIAVESALEALPGEKILPVKNGLVIPGLVNSHVHSYSNLLKGTTQGEPLELWSPGTVALGGCMTGEEMALSARLGMAEMLRNGVTSCVDHIPHPVAVAPVAEEYIAAGFRAAIAPMLHDRSDHLLLKGVEAALDADFVHSLKAATPKPVSERIEEYREYIRKFHRPDSTITVMVGPNSAQRCSEELLAAAGELAREYGLGIHAHMLESRWQRDTALADGDPVEKMHRAGMLTGRTSLAHCVWLNDKQRKLIADCGSIIVHNAAGNLFLGSGTAPVADYISRGIRVALGSDGCNCGTGHNMLEIARHALFMQRSLGSPLDVQCMWDSLLGSGAAVMGLADKLGDIAPGKKADLCVWEADVPALMPFTDPAVQCVMNLSQPSVRHSVINGRTVMEDGRITVFDEAELYSQLRERSPGLRERFSTALKSTGEIRRIYEKVYAELYI